MEKKIGSKGFGLVPAQVIIEAYCRMIMPCLLYIQTHKRACVRASVQVCERAGVEAKLNLSVE